MLLKKIVLALMAIIVFSIPTAGGRLSFDISLGPLGVMSLVGMSAFFFAIAHLLFGHRGLGRSAVPVDPSVTLFGVFVALNFASAGWAQNSSSAISSSIAYLQILVFIWLLLFLRSEPRAFGIILHAFFLGSLLLVAHSLYDAASVGLDFLQTQRIGGYDIQVNRFAFKLALGVPVAFYLSQRGIPALRWLYLMYVPAAAFLVLLSGSRTGSVALFFALLAGMWLVLRVEHNGHIRFSRARLSLLAGVVIASSVIIVPYLSEHFQYHVDRLATTVTDPMDATGTTTSGLGGRLHLWEAAFAAYIDNPVLGVGSGGANAAMLDYIGHEGLIVSLSMSGRSVHNAYLGILAGTGTVGMLLYIGALLFLVVRIRSFSRQEKVLFLSLMGVALITGITSTVQALRDYNLALFLSVAFSQLQHHPYRTLLAAETSRPAESPRSQGG